MNEKNDREPRTEEVEVVNKVVNCFSREEMNTRSTVLWKLQWNKADEPYNEKMGKNN